MTATSTVVVTAKPKPSLTPTPTAVPIPLEYEIDPDIKLDSLHPQDAISITFNQSMDVESVPIPLVFSPFVDGVFTWMEKNSVLQFVPRDSFKAGQTYLALLDERLTTLDGQTVEPEGEWEIQVLPAPTMVRREPMSSLLQERKPEIRLKFDLPMNQKSVADAFSVDPSISYQLSWDENTVIIILDEPLSPGTSYQFDLDSTAVSSAGVPLSADHRWNYRLNSLVSTITHPRSDDRNAPFTIRFNYAMDTSSVDRALTFEPDLAGSTSWNGEMTVVTFQPQDSLPSKTDYTLKFEGRLFDANGQELPLPTPFYFEGLSPIVAYYPQGADVFPATGISITFDRLMDREKTINAMVIDPPVEGNFEWEETRLYLTPGENGLAGSTSYTVTIGTGATGSDGEPLLDEPFQWKFRTGRLSEIASFGWGPNAQVLDADGRRALQFSIYRHERAALTFELYGLELDQFLDRYASGFRGGAGNEDKPISTEGTSLVSSWQVDSEPESSRSWSTREVIIPADIPPGLYLLNLKVGQLNDQLLLALTRNAIVVKQAEGQLVTWVTDINDEPLNGIQVFAFARDGQEVGSGWTDRQGICRFEVDRDPQPLIIVAQDGEDLTISGLSNEWTQTGWWGWWQPMPTGQRYAAHIYTERPIYRPGQTVYFKAIIRSDEDAILDMIPSGTSITVRLRDARDNVAQTVELNSNDFGSVNGRFELAEGAMLGDYTIEIVVDDESHRQKLKVQDYLKPDYTVKVTTDDTRYLAGDEILVSVESQYFFGEPVRDANVTYTCFALGPRSWWDETDDEYAWYQGFGTTSKGKTDSNGRLMFTIPAEDHGYTRNSSSTGGLEENIWAVEVTLDDGSHQTVSGFAVFYVYNAAEKLGLDTGGYAKEPGKSFPVRVQVTDLNDEPVAGRYLAMELCRYSYSSHNYSNVIKSTGLRTDSDGEARLVFAIDEPGFYRLYLRGEDVYGNNIEISRWIYAYSGNFGFWYGRDGALNIIADQESYAPGDTAQLLIESTFSGPALLTFERGTTRREQMVELTEPLTLVQAPILPDDAPNIFITVNAWEERDTTLDEQIYESMGDSVLHQASVELLVPVTGKTLGVSIETDKSIYSPRETATVSIRVVNERGEPVSTEVSLAMVDEAIFSLSDELSGPIKDAFYKSRENIVRSFNSMAPVRYLFGGGGGGGGGGLEGNPRSDFPDTAQWFPSLRTNAEGVVVASFNVPDSLTSWRLTAIAATADTQVGEARINFITRQDIVIRPFLPRSVTAGDHIFVSAVVHNYDDEGRQIDVSIDMAESAGTVEKADTQSFWLDSGDAVMVGWPVEIEKAGQPEILFQALVDGEVRDSIRAALTVKPLAIPDVTSQVGRITGDLATTIPMPSGALGMSTITVELYRSIAGNLLQGVEYLTGFPYGCVEQTMSKALPNAVIGRALDQLGVSNPTLKADLPAKINASLQRLYGYQHNDGGWGWWYDDSTDVYQTAWVIFGLSMTAEASYEVDPSVIERGVDWLYENMANEDVRTRAFAHYALATAGYGDLESARTMLDDLDSLDTFSQAGLALALFELGAERDAEEILDRLAETALESDGKVFWSGDEYDGYYYQKTMASATRSTALALSAFVRVTPNHELEPGIVRWLMEQRQSEGWGTTNETSFAILGLTDHLLAGQENISGTSFSVEINGELLESGELNRQDPAVSLTIPAGQLETGLNYLTIQQGGGQLYYVINSRIYLAQEQIEPAGLVEVSREYLDIESGEPITNVIAGQLVNVKLTVTFPERAAYVIVEDNLPGGLEALNEGLNTTSHVALINDWEGPRYYWQDYGYNQKEVHGDRVSFFITELDKGRRTFSYLARAVIMGDFVAMPAEVSAMYDLTYWGRSASQKLTVSEMEPVMPASSEG
ncbi:MAG: Ig-like domain-containing protein [Anaerolineales bacterium]|nr:Ig-like domain-containing protein [Anaerolineales bacterium]